jgi:hypothetical protein
MKWLWSKRAQAARLGMLCVLAAGAAQTATAAVDFRGEPASADARALADWAFDTRNTLGKPFAVVDKKDARLYIFFANGQLAGATAALLGQTPGDSSVPGVGTRVSSLGLHERTTPAGRFDSEPGRNHRGEAIVWFDYDAALAIHRLRPAAASQRRPERLASGTPEDNRISLGCVVVEPAFYDRVVAATLGRQRGVVYVLPETRDWAPMFGANLGKPPTTPPVAVAAPAAAPAAGVTAPAPALVVPAPTGATALAAPEGVAGTL